jgi:serine protease Do
MSWRSFVSAFVCCSLVSVLKAEVVSPKGIETLDFREVIQSAKQKVFPAVVFIKCVIDGHELGQKMSQEVAGSGVIISPEGELLTNWHVVNKASKIRCLLSNGDAYDAKMVGMDKSTDLALIRLQLPTGAKAPACAMLGDSTKLKEGDFVMAMGAPWGLSRSVSIGIISCTRRFLTNMSEYSLWLQTDAAISPGNSGGPLVNSAGEVIGINTLGVTGGGDLGFAVPSETIQYVVKLIREHGEVQWTWSGLQLQPLRDFNRDIYFEETEGVVVSETDADSPARRAGILAKDRILEVNGRKTNVLTEEDLPALRRELGLLPKTKPVDIKLTRDGKEMELQIQLQAKGQATTEELDCPRWDFTVKPINQFETPDLYYYQKKGVFVFGIKERGNARNSGLLRRDIIVKIDNQEVTSLEELKEIHQAALANVAKKNRVILTILRNGLTRQIVLNFSRDFEKE